MSDPAVIFSQAETQPARGDFELALASYQSLFSQLPEHPLLHARLGWMALLMNDPPLAVEHLSATLNLGDRSNFIFFKS